VDKMLGRRMVWVEMSHGGFVGERNIKAPTRGVHYTSLM
jgi:hypothetical protein